MAGAFLAESEANLASRRANSGKPHRSVLSLED